MKKIFVFVVMLFLVSSCALFDWEDKQVNEAFLTWAFNNKLHMLDLSNQNLTRIPDFKKYLTWAILDNVWYINLMSNNIEYIDADRLTIFPNLKELNLSYNKIKEVKLDHNFISKIELHKNEITKVDLTGLTNLKEVNLGYNKITSLDNIKLNKNITNLQLQHNQLTDLNNIWEYKDLSSLKLEFNKLIDKNFASLDWLDKLKFITVKYNDISKDLEKSFEEFNKKMK